MKKPILILAVYTILIYLMIFGLVTAFLNYPPLLDGDQTKYKMTAVTLGFFILLPSIFISGFIASCAVAWKKNKAKFPVRFSHEIMKKFKGVFLLSLALTFILSVNREILIPHFENTLHSIEAAPVELDEAITTAQNLLLADKTILALQYAEKAMKIGPRNEDAKAIYKTVHDMLDIEDDMQMFNKYRHNKIEKPLHSQNAGYTILELIDRSEKAALSENWFEAHYWAQLAVDACDGTNTNLSKASEYANRAWKMLNLPKGYDSSREHDYFAKKKEGYKAFSRGDFLKAYYTFLELSKDEEWGENDPDVKRFFELAKEDIENQYFFFDETEHMKDLTSQHNIHFSLDYPDGSKEIFYISNAMDIKKDGRLTRYLENMYVVHYNSEDVFQYSFHVPYAKTIAVPVSEFGTASLYSLGIRKNWKMVPVVFLQSVDRDTEGLISRPEYNFERTEIPKDILAENGMTYLNFRYLNEVADLSPDFTFETMKILPMPYSDFHMINEASAGPEYMSIPSLFKFIPSTVKYGFAKETFTENLTQRATYPIFILLMFILCASLAWDYKIESPRDVFRFQWIFIIPIFGFLTIYLVNGAHYIFTVINYIFVSLFGTLALPLAATCHMAFVFLASLLFVSRKS